MVTSRQVKTVVAMLNTTRADSSVKTSTAVLTKKTTKRQTRSANLPNCVTNTASSNESSAVAIVKRTGTTNAVTATMVGIKDVVLPTVKIVLAIAERRQVSVMIEEIVLPEREERISVGGKILIVTLTATDDLIES